MRFVIHNSVPRNDTYGYKLHSYRSSATATPARRPADNWADEILGLNTPERPAHGSDLKDEVESYLMERPYGLGSIRFWEVFNFHPHPSKFADTVQENQLRYPTIFAMAVDLLAIQGSAVPCERVFSSSAKTDTARRNNISPELMEALQMLKFSV
jgi:hypothetical protein